MKHQLEEWALLGATIRLKEIDAESDRIYRTFPQLKPRNPARREAMKRAWVTRKAKQTS